MRLIAMLMFCMGVAGLVVTMPLWLMGTITDRQMIGITLALSWAALIYEGWNTVRLEKERHGGA